MISAISHIISSLLFLQLCTILYCIPSHFPLAIFDVQSGTVTKDYLGQLDKALEVNYMPVTCAFFCYSMVVDLYHSVQNGNWITLFPVHDCNWMLSLIKLDGRGLDRQFHFPMASNIDKYSYVCPHS